MYIACFCFDSRSCWYRRPPSFKPLGVVLQQRMDKEELFLGFSLCLNYPILILISSKHHNRTSMTSPVWPQVVPFNASRSISSWHKWSNNLPSLVNYFPSAAWSPETKSWIFKECLKASWELYGWMLFKKAGAVIGLRKSHQLTVGTKSKPTLSQYLGLAYSMGDGEFPKELDPMPCLVL